MISNSGAYGRPYVDTTVTLTATITYSDASQVVNYNVTAKRYYSDLTDGVTMGYMYFSNSTASDNTYENLDIIVFAHLKALADGSLENISEINSCLPTRITRAHNYGTYCLLSLGMMDSDHLSYMSTIANSSSLRATLITNIINAINDLGLDGVDIDWEYPSSSDKEKFTLFMSELYSAVKANNPNHLVCVATGIETYTRYDFTNSKDYIDYISMMTYDMQHGSIASHHAALNYKSYNCYRSVQDAYNYYVTNSGIDPSKIIMGIPFYGRKFTDTDGLGKSGTASGALSYSVIASSYLTDPNYVECWDDDCKVPYLYSSTDRIFITYENPDSIALKVAYAKEKGFGGVMYWQDAQDSGDTLFNAIITNMSGYKD